MHSAFICLLHLANEKSKYLKLNFIDLIFEAEHEEDMTIRKAVKRGGEVF